MVALLDSHAPENQTIHGAQRACKFLVATGEDKVQG